MVHSKKSPNHVLTLGTYMSPGDKVWQQYKFTMVVPISGLLSQLPLAEIHGESHGSLPT